MANEKRLIDANTPLKQLSDYMEKLHCSDDYQDGLYRGMEIAESYIKNAPTVDAVEVVRCKNCKHSKVFTVADDPMYNHLRCCRRKNYTEGVDGYDFCSYGERKGV